MSSSWGNGWVLKYAQHWSLHSNPKLCSQFLTRRGRVMPLPLNSTGPVSPAKVNNQYQATLCFFPVVGESPSSPLGWLCMRDAHESGGGSYNSHCQVLQGYEKWVKPLCHPNCRQKIVTKGTEILVKGPMQPQWAHTAAYGMFYFWAIWWTQKPFCFWGGSWIHLQLKEQNPVAAGMMGIHCLQNPGSQGGAAENTGVGLQSCHM